MVQTVYIYFPVKYEVATVVGNFPHLPRCIALHSLRCQMSSDSSSNLLLTWTVLTKTIVLNSGFNLAKIM